MVSLLLLYYCVYIRTIKSCSQDGYCICLQSTRNETYDAFHGGFAIVSAGSTENSTSFQQYGRTIDTLYSWHPRPFQTLECQWRQNHHLGNCVVVYWNSFPLWMFQFEMRRSSSAAIKYRKLLFRRLDFNWLDAGSIQSCCYTLIRRTLSKIISSSNLTSLHHCWLFGNLVLVAFWKMGNVL